MRVFARDPVLARSKYWYHMKRQHKVRKIQGEIVSTSEIFEKNSNNIKNYGIFFRYQTRTLTVNMYKEYRSNTLNAAVSQLYNDLAGKHSGRAETVQIIRTSILKNSSVQTQSALPTKMSVSQRPTNARELPHLPLEPPSRPTDLPLSEQLSECSLSSEREGRVLSTFHLVVQAAAQIRQH